MQLSVESMGSTNQPVVVDDGDVFDAISALEGVHDALMSIDQHLNQGAQLEDMLSNITGVQALMSTEGMSEGIFKFLNADGGLSALLQTEVVWDEAQKAQLTAATTESLGTQMDKAWVTLKEWFAKLIDWISRLWTKLTDLFRSNEKILARVLETVKKGSLRVAPGTKVSGISCADFHTNVAKFQKYIETENVTDEQLASAQRTADSLFASVKTEMTLTALGWDKKDEVEKCIVSAQDLLKIIKKKGKDTKAVEKAAAKAEAGMKKDKADSAEIKAARNEANNSVKMIALRARVLKWAVGQAIAMGRLYKVEEKKKAA